MNASLVVLLLFLSTCQGKEQDHSPPSGSLPTTKWQNKVETPRDGSCPDPTDIEPCVCADSNTLVMDCSNVEDEEQLRTVFSASFPTTKFYEFKMDGNQGVKILEGDVFGNVNFHQLYIRESVLETVKISALTPSFSTLTDITIYICMLETFPFERLTEFTSLQRLDLLGNKIHTLPPLSSPSLRILSLAENLIVHLTPDVFTLLPAIKDIYLYDNQLTEIPTGTFTGLPHLEVISLFSNDISYLQSLIFDLDSNLSSRFYLFLNSNNIEWVEVDAFKGVAVNGTIDMNYNALTRLPDEVWRPVLEKNIILNLKGNALACGCDVVWLVRDFQLLATVNDARCADGTLLTELNPADFDHCG